MVFEDLKKESNDICRLCGTECLKELKGGAGIINAYKTLEEQSFLVRIKGSISLGQHIRDKSTGHSNLFWSPPSNTLYHTVCFIPCLIEYILVFHSNVYIP